MAYKKAVKDLDVNGFAVIPNFLSEEELQKMENEITRLLSLYDPEKDRSTFSSTNRQGADQYYLESSDKVRYFLEDDVFDNEGKLKIPKNEAVNKIGHGLHYKNDVFKEITFSNKIKELVKELGYKKPVVVQGMFIFKNAGRGGEVTPHQDATFLHTDPPQLTGLWFPLQDATEENGCLWFQPGSQKGKLYSRFVRNNDPNGPPMTYIDYGSKDIFNDESKYVCCPAKRGSCVMIHGLVIHKSEKNTSPKARPIYTAHVFEKQGATWSKENWCQETADAAFPLLHGN